MKLRIWHFVTPTPTAWQQDKPADDNGTAEHFLDGCVAAHRTANNGWQTSPTRTPQRIWFLENVAGGPPEDVDGAWVRCYFDPQSGRWVALGYPPHPLKATSKLRLNLPQPRQLVFVGLTKSAEYGVFVITLRFPMTD